MKNTIVLGVLLLLLPITILAVGCHGNSGSSPADIQRARLVADENITLKKQVELQNEEIKKQKMLCEKYQQEKDRSLEEAGQTALKLMETLSQTSQQAEQLGEENIRLKETIAKLEEALKKTPSETPK